MQDPDFLRRLAQDATQKTYRRSQKIYLGEGDGVPIVLLYDGDVKLSVDWFTKPSKGRSDGKLTPRMTSPGNSPRGKSSKGNSSKNEDTSPATPRPRTTYTATDGVISEPVAIGSLLNPGVERECSR